MTRPTSFTCPACGGFGVGKVVHQPHCAKYIAPETTEAEVVKEVTVAPVVEKIEDVVVFPKALELNPESVMVDGAELPGFPEDAPETDVVARYDKHTLVTMNKKGQIEILKGMGITHVGEEKKMLGMSNQTERVAAILERQAEELKG